MSETEKQNTKVPSLFRNYISFVGAAITIAALVSVVLLFLFEITSRQENPYLGILTYIIVEVVGMLVERRRRHRTAPGEISA